MIICIALRLKNKLVLSLPAPYRHNDIMELANNIGINVEEVRNAEQGFLTNYGRFMNRYTAAQYAFTNGQIKRQVMQLFSEDLW